MILRCLLIILTTSRYAPKPTADAYKNSSAETEAACVPTNMFPPTLNLSQNAVFPSCLAADQLAQTLALQTSSHIVDREA